MKAFYDAEFAEELQKTVEGLKSVE